MTHSLKQRITELLISEFVKLIETNDFNLEFIEYCLDHDVDINTVDSSGSTLLIKAIMQSQEKIIEFLLSKGADPNIKNNMDKSPLVLACRRIINDEIAERVIKLLIKYKANINDQHGKKLTTALIMWSKIQTDITFEQKIIKFLIHAGANVNSQDILGKTPLMYSCARDNDPEYIERHSTIELLLESGADINLRDNSNRNILSYALHRNDIKTVKLLLSKNIDIENLSYFNPEDSQKLVEILYDKYNSWKIKIRYHPDKSGAKEASENFKLLCGEEQSRKKRKLNDKNTH